MPAFVLDASVALSWVLPDERATASEALRPTALQQGVCVPALWSMEVCNVLALRRQRANGITIAEFDDAIQRLVLLPKEVDTACTEMPAHGALRLALHHRLTLYDATYLELAVRRRLPLAILDRDLRAAAQAEAITCLP